MPLFLGVAGGVQEGASWQFGIYWRRTVDTDPTGALNIWSAAMGALFGQVPPGTPLYLSMMSTRDNNNNLWVYRIDESTDRKVAKYEAFSGWGSGQSAAGQPPIETTVLVLLRAGSRFVGTGRVNLPRITTAFTGSGFVNSGPQQNIHDWFQAARDFLASNQSQMVVRNRRDHTDSPVLSHAVSNHLGHLKSRTGTGVPRYI